MLAADEHLAMTRCIVAVELAQRDQQDPLEQIALEQRHDVKWFLDGRIAQQTLHGAGFVDATDHPQPVGFVLAQVERGIEQMIGEQVAQGARHAAEPFELAGQLEFVRVAVDEQLEETASDVGFRLTMNAQVQDRMGRITVDHLIGE